MESLTARSREAVKGEIVLGIIFEPTYSNLCIDISDESPFATFFFALNNDKYLKIHLGLFEYFNTVVSMETG